MKLLSILLLCCALPVLAEEPFTGTWKIDLGNTKLSQKPIKYELKDGVYKCTSCDPPYTVKADGTDQAVAGHPAFDTISVRIIDDHTIETITKKAGKVSSQGKISVSADGKTFTAAYTGYPASGDKPVTSTGDYKRAGAPVAGSHAISGSWTMDKVENVSDNGLTITFEQSADGLKMKTPTGDHFDAKFDGKEYPAEGSPQTDKVVLKRIGPKEIEETDKLAGKVVSTSRMTVSADGKTMTVVSHEHDGRVNTVTATKQ